MIIDFYECNKENLETVYEEYVKNPTITKQRMFYETMEEVLPSLKVVIEGSDGEMQTFYPIESFPTFETGNAASAQ